MQNAREINFNEIFYSLEPGYQLINWIGAQFNQIFIVNLISGFIFLSGLISYSKRQTYPWLSLIIAFPVLIIIAGLGFTRQSCAIGIELFALINIEEKKYIKAISLIVFASTFHLSSIFLLILFIPEILKNILRPKFLFPFITLTLILIYYFYDSAQIAFDNYYSLYVINEFDLVWSSSGALFRLLPSVFAALILILNKRKFCSYIDKEKFSLYERMSYIVLFFLILVIVFSENAAFVDRFSIYFYPITIFVFNKTIDFKILNISRFDYHLIYISSYFIYTFIWLLLAVHLDAFVPYKNYLFI